MDILDSEYESCAWAMVSVWSSTTSNKKGKPARPSVRPSVHRLVFYLDSGTSTRIGDFSCF